MHAFRESKLQPVVGWSFALETPPLATITVAGILTCMYWRPPSRTNVHCPLECHMLLENLYDLERIAKIIFS